MKPGLSLRVSQHLALTPQLQQSIRLLQLSTQELSQEIEQMLDENPFLERSVEEAPREEFGLAQSDVPAQGDDAAAEIAIYSGADSASTSSLEGKNDVDSTGASDEFDWGGDGTAEIAADDGEWGGEAPARNHGSSDGEGEADAADLAHGHESLTAFLHRQALSLRLSALDRAALQYLIESLNDDGYLEESLEALALGIWRNALVCSSRRCSRRARQTGRPCRPRSVSANSRWNCWHAVTCVVSLPCVVPARSAHARPWP